MKTVDMIIAYETGELEAEDTLKLFARLVKNGQAWSLQGSYGRTAQSLIDEGYISKEGKILKKEDKGGKKMKHLLLSCETILPNDYPIHGGYVYIGDMRFFVNNILVRGTVADLKREYKLKEIRICDTFGHRNLKIGDELTTEI